MSRKIALLSLPDNLKGEIMRRRITPSAAVELSSLDEASKIELSQVITEMGLSRRIDVRRLARRRRRHGKEDTARGEGSARHQLSSMKAYHIDRILAKCTAALKEDIAKFDGTVDSLSADDEDSWVIREALLWHKGTLNSQADYLLRLRKKFRRDHDL